MFKLLRNYIREQKNNLLQLFGLRFLVMIMIISFLSLNFSNNYLFNEYINDIVHNEFNQYTYFYLSKMFNLMENIVKTIVKLLLYLSNINYYRKDNTINKEKMAKATFQLTKPYLARPDIYRFTFHDGADNSEQYFGIGDDLFNATGHDYIDFKINIPINYPNYDTHQVTVQQYTDIINQAQLYEIMSMGMLYQNIEWQHAIMVNDLLITSKNFAFIETGPEYVINKAIIVNEDVLQMWIRFNKKLNER